MQKYDRLNDDQLNRLSQLGINDQKFLFSINAFLSDCWLPSEGVKARVAKEKAETFKNVARKAAATVKALKRIDEITLSDFEMYFGNKYSLVLEFESLATSCGDYAEYVDDLWGGAPFDKAIETLETVWTQTCKREVNTEPTSDFIEFLTICLDRENKDSVYKLLNNHYRRRSKATKPPTNTNHNAIANPKP